MTSNLAYANESSKWEPLPTSKNKEYLFILFY